MIFNIFKKEKEKPKVDTCIFCGKELDADKVYSELKYEALDENEVLQEYSYGKICNQCSETLEKAGAGKVDILEEDGSEVIFTEDEVLKEDKDESI